MTEPERRVERRLAERCPMEEAVTVRTVAARNQPRPQAQPATLVDVSVNGAGLRVPGGFELREGWAVEVGIDGGWSRCRIVWTRLDLHGHRLAGVEFLDAVPEFLPRLLQWLDRQDAEVTR